jgi:hypothetical protein
MTICYDPQTMSTKNLDPIKAILEEHERSYANSAWRWKAGYRVLLVFSAIFSSGSALIGQFQHFTFAAAPDVAAILAASAAVITTLIAALDFESNWRVNRLSRHSVKGLLLESEKSTADPDKLLSSLQDVVKQRMEDLSKHD